MKSLFSTAWKSSTQPRKQHKYRHNAPLHIKHRFLNAHLSKELRKKYGKRSLPLRKGDEVLVMQGSFKRKKAKVGSVDMQRSRVALEGLQRTRRDGTKVAVTFHPRILQIQALITDDKERLAALQRTATQQASQRTATQQASQRTATQQASQRMATKPQTPSVQVKAN